MYSAKSFRSRRELSIDVAEHRTILKNNQNSYYPRFSFRSKTGIELPETGVSFLLRIWLFSKIGLCSAISFKMFRRELSIDVAEHRSMLKTTIHTTPVLISYQKQVYHSLKRGFGFCCLLIGSHMSPELYLLPNFVFWVRRPHGLAMTIIK